MCGVDGGLCDGGVSGAGGAVQLISCPASRALNCSTLKDWISACALSPRMVAAPSRVSAPAAHAETLVNRHVPEFERVAHFAEFCFVSHLTTTLVKASLWLSQPRGRKCRKERGRRLLSARGRLREDGCERMEAAQYVAQQACAPLWLKMLSCCDTASQNLAEPQYCLSTKSRLITF